MRCRACQSIYTSPENKENLCPFCAAKGETAPPKDYPASVKRREKLLIKLARKNGSVS